MPPGPSLWRLTGFQLSPWWFHLDVKATSSQALHVRHRAPDLFPASSSVGSCPVLQLLRPRALHSSVVPPFLSHPTSNLSGNYIGCTSKMPPESDHFSQLPLLPSWYKPPSSWPPTVCSQHSTQNNPLKTLSQSNTQKLCKTSHFSPDIQAKVLTGIARPLIIWPPVPSLTPQPSLTPALTPS